MPPPTSTTSNTNWFVRFHNGHENLKNAVHSYWRQNAILSPRGTAGKIFMSCFYFSLPVVFGYVVVNKIVDGTESTIQDRIENTSSTTSSTDVPAPKIGAGGWGGGVNLATSDKATQDVNRINLERFLKKQRKLKEKREREAATAAAAGKE